MIFSKTSVGHSALQEKLNQDRKKPKNEPLWADTSKSDGCEGDCSPKKLFGSRDVAATSGCGFGFGHSKLAEDGVK